MTMGISGLALARAPRAVAAVAAAALLGAGCASTAIPGDKFTDGTVEYKVAGPGPGWREVSVDNANVAWIHDATASALMVNSHCEGVEDAPLDVLTRHLTMGMTDRVVLDEQRFEKSRREALETTLTAKIDGVERKMRVLVLKKDGCVYDLVLTCHPERFDAAAPGYEQVKGTLDVMPRADRR